MPTEIAIRSWLHRAASRRNRGGRDGGASLVEYALLVALIALVCFAAVTFLGAETGEQFSQIGNSLAA